MHFTDKLAGEWVLLSVLCALSLVMDRAYAQTPYYAGKTITIVRGGGPGGSGEFQSRALIPYLKKYIPGNPTIMMEFMDGASGTQGRELYLHCQAGRTEDRLSRRHDSRADPWSIRE